MASVSHPNVVQAAVPVPETPPEPGDYQSESSQCRRLPAFWDDWYDEPDICPDDEDDRSEIISNDPDLIPYPLDNGELQRLFYPLHMPNAGWRYLLEFGQEARRLHRYVRTHPDFSMRAAEYLGGPHGTEMRQSIIIRHYIKKRWERLGVWNHLWGIPGRLNPGEIDHTDFWVWDWERTYADRDPDHPLRRMLRLRQGLWQGQAGPRHPHGTLASDASIREAEAFLLSRPFFMLRLEEYEEIQRMKRSDERWDEDKIVRERWYERNDWKEEWNDLDGDGNCLPGWTWPHENPESEIPPYEELNSMEDIEFTPSEADALEETDRYELEMSSTVDEMTFQAMRRAAASPEDMRHDAMRREISRQRDTPDLGQVNSYPPGMMQFVRSMQQRQLGYTGVVAWLGGHPLNPDDLTGRA
ncbi:unnamed protein product [Clonostachys rhizophaga]|uniref:Uncharacterized protein n=1 Tax=Clonostachys rhizophaga TaxID=160324 RepID=A0A9N9YH33_9HYPO|nr:unnamed protein product [Clonostachys rhizophaga]